MNYINKIKKYLLFFYCSILSLKPYFNNFLELRKHTNIKVHELIMGVYDYESYEGPWSIGDFICYLFFFKCFVKYKKKIEVLIIVDFKKLNKFKRNILRIQVACSKIFLSKFLHKVCVISWKDFKKLNLNKYYIPYKEDILKRKDIRQNFVSMYNKMLINCNQKQLNDFLINKHDFDKYKPKKNFPKKYITWHIRKNSKWSQFRNIKKTEFIELYNILREKVNTLPIIIISDQTGCNFAKSISKKNNLDLLFCKDISKSIFSDFYLMAKGKLFFTFKPAGMMCVPWFAKFNFIWGGGFGLKDQISSGRSVSVDKLHFWWTKKQIWNNSNSFNDFKRRVNNINFSKFK